MKEHPKNRNEVRITRREFHGLGAVAALTAAAPWLAAEALAAETELATDVPANKALLSSIGFVSKTEKEGQQCSGCLLYQAAEGGVGKCQIIQNGVVPAEGWCLSFAPRPPSS